MPISKEKPWLQSVGKSSSDFLQLFYNHDYSRAVKATMNAGVKKYDKFIKSVIGYTLIQQIAMTVIAALGILCVLLLLIMPYFIFLYTKRQKAALRDSELKHKLKATRLGWLIFEFLLIFIAITIFGAALMYMSADGLHQTSPNMFKLARGFITESYEIKEYIANAFRSSVHEVYRSVLDTLQVMYDVNDNIEDKFMKKVNYLLKPVRYLAISIKWEVTGLASSLEYNKQQLESVLNEGNSEILNLSDRYTTAIMEMKTVFDSENASRIFGPVVDPLLEGLNFTYSNTTVQNFDNSIQRLQEISKLNFHGRLQNLSRHLHISIGNPNYDPTDIIEKLRAIAFNSEAKIIEDVSPYVDYIEEAFTEKEKFQILRIIKEVEDEVLEIVEYFIVFILIFSIISIVLVIISLLSYILGIVGTKCFQFTQTGVGVYKSGLSHASAKVIVIFTYITVIFLAFFWLLSIFIFITSAVPLEMCLSAEDTSFFELNVDAGTLLSSKIWYRIYSPEKYNFSLSDSIKKCGEDGFYFGLIPDPVVNKSHFDEVKNNLDTFIVSEAVENALQNLPNVSISESETAALDIKNMVDIDVTLYFRNYSEHLEYLKNSNASLILNKVKNNPESSKNLSDTARDAVISYDALVESLSSAKANEIVFNTSVKVANDTAEMLVNEIEYFEILLEGFIEFLQMNTSSLYLSILNETVIEMINSVEYGLELSVTNFRKKLTICPVLLQFYNEFLHIACKEYLYPIASCWLGSLLIDTFLLLVVFLCLYSLTLFLIPLKAKASSESLEAIQPEDIPSEVMIAESSISHILVPKEMDSSDGRDSSDGKDSSDVKDSSDGKDAETDESKNARSSVSFSVAEATEDSESTKSSEQETEDDGSAKNSLAAVNKSQENETDDTSSSVWEKPEPDANEEEEKEEDDPKNEAKNEIKNSSEKSTEENKDEITPTETDIKSLL